MKKRIYANKVVMHMLLLTFLALIFILDSRANCYSIDGHLDNGRCDKTDINNKKCVEGTPNCWRPPAYYEDEEGG